MPTGSHQPRLITLIALAALTTITLNMFLPSLPAIARDFDASLALTSVSISGFLAATAIVQIMVGPLSDRIGRRPVVLAALVIFAVASVVCALTQNIWVFLAARMAQSAMSSGFAMAMAITRDTMAPQHAAGRLATINMFMGFAPLLGPMLGGFIDAAFGWRAVFWVYAAAGTALWLWAYRDLAETRARAPEQAPENIGSLLSIPLFWAFVFCSSFSIGAFFIFISSVPIVGAASFALSSAQIGIGVGSITAGYIVGSAISSRLGGKTELTTMMLAGRTSAVLGPIAGLLAFALFDPHPMMLFAATIFVGFGNGLTLPSSNAGALSVKPELAGTAAGVSGAFVVGVGAILTTITAPMIAARPDPSVLLMLILVATGAAYLSAFIARKLSIVGSD